MAKRKFLLPSTLAFSLIFSGCQITDKIAQELKEKFPGLIAPPSSSSWTKQGNQYSTVVDYESPGGLEQNTFTITINNGVISDVSVEVTTNLDASIIHQNNFAAALPQIIIGKKISEIQDLDIVSGASNTTAAFNSALQKLRVQLGS